MHRWKDNVEVSLTNRDCRDELISAGSEWVKLCKIVTKVTKLRVSYEVANFLTSLANMDFSINTYRHRKDLFS